jgi:hypothetical protein
MRLSIAVVGLLSAIAAPAAAFDLFPSSEQNHLGGDGDKIPGNSPIEHCDNSHSHDIIQIEKVDLTPNPPLA